jgi:hypothetical protein
LSTLTGVLLVLLQLVRSARQWRTVWLPISWPSCTAFVKVASKPLLDVLLPLVM